MVTSLHFTIRTVALAQSTFRASITMRMLSCCRFVASWTCLSPSPFCNPWKQLLFHFYNSIFQECYRVQSCNTWPFRIDLVFFLSTLHNFLKIFPSDCMHWYSVLSCWILLHITDISVYLLLKKIWPDFGCNWYGSIPISRCVCVCTFAYMHVFTFLGQRCKNVITGSYFCWILKYFFFFL